MSVVPWVLRPKIDELTLTDVLMRRTPSQTIKNQEIPFSDVQAFLQGSALKIIASEADLPPLINGFRTLDQTKDYLFTEPSLFFDPILIPAGYIGLIKSSFLKEGTLTYLGAGSFFNTLNLEGIITSIIDINPGVAILVTTSAPHGLFNGQFVNITGTGVTEYDQQRLQVSNVTATTFDVQIPSVGGATGFFNTGFEIMQTTNIDFTCPGTANLYNLTSSGSLGSFFITSSMTELGFLSPGIIRNCPVVAMDITLLAFIAEGMTFDNCRNISLFRTRTPSLVAIPAIRGLIFQGASSFEVVVDAVGLDMTDPDQRPIRIDPSVPAISSYTIQNSPDNLVATDYYDTSTGGLDKKDPRVIALNNGSRPNSMTLAEARSVLIFEVDGSGGIPVPVVDITPVSGDWIQDSSTEEFTVDISTGLTTYIGIRPISVKIEYSISAAQSNGGNQNVNFDLRINGVTEGKTTRSIMTSGSGIFVPTSYDGGNFDINPGDTFQIFKHNVTNTTNTDTTVATLLITKN